MDRVAVLTLAAPREGWEPHACDLRSVYGRQLSALMADWLDASPALRARLVVIAGRNDGAPGSPSPTWLLPEALPDVEALSAVRGLAGARIVIGGRVERADDELQLEYTVTRAEGREVLVTLSQRVARRSVVRAVAGFAREIAAVLEVAAPALPPDASLAASEDRAVDLFLLARDLELGRRTQMSRGTSMSPASTLGRAVALSPGFGLATDLLLAWAAAAMNHYDPAVLFGLERATETPDADPRLWTAWGLLAARRSTDSEQALTFLNRALDHGGDETRVRVELGELLSGLDRPEEARAHLRLAAEHCPDDPALLDRIGALLGNLNDLDGAVGVWKRGAHLAPWDGTFLAQLGRTAAEEGKNAQAWSYFARGLLAADVAGQLYRYALQLASEKGEVPGAFSDRLRGHDPRGEVGAEPRLWLGELRAIAGDPEGAASDLEVALGSAPEPAVELRIRRARLDLKRPGAGAVLNRLFGEDLSRASAMREIEGLLALDAEFWPVVLLCGVACRRGGDARRAGLHLRRAMELAPDQVAVLREFAGYLCSSNEYVEAIDVYRRALALDMHQVTLRTGLAEALFSEGRSEEAAEEIARALRLAPMDPSVRRVQRRILGQGETKFQQWWKMSRVELCKIWVSLKGG